MVVYVEEWDLIVQFLRERGGDVISKEREMWEIISCYIVLLSSKIIRSIMKISYNRELMPKNSIMGTGIVISQITSRGS